MEMAIKLPWTLTKPNPQGSKVWQGLAAGPNRESRTCGGCSLATRCLVRSTATRSCSGKGMSKIEGSWDPVVTPRTLRLQQMWKNAEKLKFPQLLQVDLPPSQGPESQHQIRMSLSQNQGILQVTARILGLKQSKIAWMCMLIFPFPWSHMVAWFIPKPPEAPWLSASWEPSSQLAASGQFRWPGGAVGSFRGSWNQAIRV